MRYEIIDLMIAYYSLPAKSGIYILVGLNNEIIYIGSSVNLKSRVYFKRLLDEYLRYSLSHLFVFECDNFKWLEKRLIALFKPKANIHVDGKWIKRT